VLAVLSHDAVRLPCGLLLPATSAELPLTSLAAGLPAHTLAQASRARSGDFMVGDQAVSWTGPAGPVVVRAVREWAPARPVRGQVAASALAALRSALGLDGSHTGDAQRRHLDRCGFCIARAIQNPQPWPESGVGAQLPAGLAEATSAEPGIDARLLADLAASAGDHDASLAAAADLLGRGPGLTPSGDDVLAGFLVGAVAFGVEAAALRHAISALAPARTTALSAALLWHAARGECIDELAAVAAVLTGQPAELGGREQAGRAVSRLLSVGHSSGAALATGLVIAAERALQEQERRAA
jgi:hypothetical protein